MKTFVRLVIIGFGAFIFPLWMFVTSFIFSHIQASWILTQLENQNAYRILTEQFIHSISAASKNSETSDEFSDLIPVIRQTVTEPFVRKKIEQLVTQTYPWLFDQSNESPVLTFIELKDVLIAQNPTLANELKINRSDVQVQPVSPDPEYDYGLPQPSYTSIANSAIDRKLRIDIGKRIGFIKPYIRMGMTVYWGISIILVLLLIIICIMTYSLKFIVRWIGFSLILWTGFNIIPMVLFFSPSVFLLYVTRAIGNEFVTLLPLIIKPLMTKLMTTELIISAVFIGISLFFFIVSVFVPRSDS